ncbi:hypothetical protein SLA2020_477470 [Shorea laevis]
MKRKLKRWEQRYMRGMRGKVFQNKGYGNPTYPSTPRQISFRNVKEPLLYDLEKRKSDPKRPNTRLKVLPYFTSSLSLSLYFQPCSFILTLLKSQKTLPTSVGLDIKVDKRRGLSGECDLERR